MSAARCCRVWKVPIGTPNWLRVLRYSTVVFSDSSIAPTASAHIAVRASSTTRSISGNAFSGSPIAASAPTSTPVKVMSAACRPSWVG